jgi:hypothetical protein
MYQRDAMPVAPVASVPPDDVVVAMKACNRLRAAVNIHSVASVLAGALDLYEIRLAHAGAYDPLTSRRALCLDVRGNRHCLPRGS